MQLMKRACSPSAASFNTASGMDCMQSTQTMSTSYLIGVSIPQAVWIACNARIEEDDETEAMFQYRKRYGLHAIRKKRGEYSHGNNVSIPQAVWIACNFHHRALQALSFEFQYRKRYGLHAMRGTHAMCRHLMSFNTASGMDCMQWATVNHLHRFFAVSIPQAVWIACNNVFAS